MTFFEEAEALSGLIAMKRLTQKELAELMGTSQSYIANKLRLLRLTAEARELILGYELTERHARALLRISEEDMLIETIHKIGKIHLPVAASEALIDSLIIEREAKKLYTVGPHGGIERFERILRDSLISLKEIGVSCDLRTSSFGKTKYITIAVEDA